MKVVFLNLPYPRPLVRRYTCTYFPHNFLLPPLELMSLSAIFQREGGVSCLIDAVAEGLSVTQVNEKIAEFQGECLVSLLGVETLSEDITTLDEIKQRHPGLLVVCFGYYPTLFAEDLLQRCAYIDYILRGEPELSFLDLYHDLIAFKTVSTGKNGQAQRLTKTARVYPLGGTPQRIEDLDALPFPDRTSLDHKAYHEFLSPRPFTTLLTARGCPQSCSFCIPTYGRRYVPRSVANVIMEMKEVVDRYGVKMIRIMDDDFCYDRQRVLRLCDQMVRQGIRVQWSCLARFDHLDPHLLAKMKQAGCCRIYLGIETFSRRLLGLYRKQIDYDTLPERVRLMHALGMDCVGFFLISEQHTEAELRNDIARTLQCDFDHVIVSQLIAYPGTPEYAQREKTWTFSLFPYQLQLTDEAQRDRLVRWEKKFYRAFYFRLGYVIKALSRAMLYPADYIKGVAAMCSYLYSRPGGRVPSRDLF